MAQASIVFQACCHLHNYVIDQQVYCQLEPIEIEYKSGGTALDHVPSDVGGAPTSGSIFRQKLIQKILSKSLSRPELNVMHRLFQDERGLYTAVN